MVNDPWSLTPVDVFDTNCIVIEEESFDCTEVCGSLTNTGDLFPNLLPVDLLGLSLTSALTNLLGNILTLGSKISVEVGVKLTISTSRTPSHNTVTVAIPPNDQTPVSTGGSVFLDVASVVPTITGVKLNGKVVPVLSQVTALTNPILNELVIASGGFVNKSLTPLVDNINQQFIGPVARMIGLRLAGADVYGVGVTCGMPRLVG